MINNSLIKLAELFYKMAIRTDEEKNQYIKEYIAELKRLNPDYRKELTDRELVQRKEILNKGGLPALILKLRIQIADRKKDLTKERPNAAVTKQFVELEPKLYEFRNKVKEIILGNYNINYLSETKGLGQELRILLLGLSTVIPITIGNILKEIDVIFDQLSN